MRIEELIAFYNLSNYNSFSSAAKDLYTSRYSLMRNITNLENDLGVKLFQRRSNGIYLTAVGKEVLNEVSGIVDHYNKMISIANSNKSTRPVLRIGCYANNSTTYAMLNVIRLFNASQGDYSAEYVCVEEKSMIKMLKDGEIDFAFTVEKSSDSDFQSYTVLKRDLFALVNKDSKYAKKKIVTDKDIMSSDIVIPLLTGGTERILIKKYGDAVAKKIALKSNDFYYLFLYVSHNDCIGLFNLDDSKAAEKIFDNLVSLPISPSISADLGLVTVNTKDKAATKKKFVEFVSQNYNKSFT